MKVNVLKSSIILTLFLFFPCIVALSNVRLPKLISDGMILQRNTPVKIWGWADPSEKISVSFMDSAYTTTADTDGNWSVITASFNAGGPYNMEIQSENSITIHDILIGDIWVCAGQSNMETPMSRLQYKYPEELVNPNNDSIRLFMVPQSYNFKKLQNDFSYGKWEKLNAETILKFSGVAYFFAKEIYNKYHVPVGILINAVGGSPAEAWLSEETLKNYPAYYNELQKFKNDSLLKAIDAEDKSRIGNWYTQLYLKDEGNKLSKWYDPAYNASGWSKMQIPNFWTDTDLKGVNGVVWFRKDIDVPANMEGKESVLILGRLIDADSTYINGSFVGTVSYQYPPRRYTIPAGLLKAGKNTVTVRLISNSGDGGFIPDKEYKIISNENSIELSGEWEYHIGATMEPLRGETFIRWKPGGLYNAMLAPLFNYPIKGVLWYQGESNTSRWEEYRAILPDLINDWRQHWNIPELPFMIVQLPNLSKAKSQPSEGDWPNLREAQLMALRVPNTGLAVTIDIGEWNDIHPLNKKDVGKRLALAAEKVAYHENNIVFSGPVYQSMKIKGSKIVLSFNNTGSGLIAKNDGKLRQFAIAGSDRKFVWANAKIEGDRVIVWCDAIKNPLAVRYAWADNPEGANLFNKEGLPASPFRTDDF